MNELNSAGPVKVYLLTLIALGAVAVTAVDLFAASPASCATDVFGATQGAGGPRNLILASIAWLAASALALAVAIWLQRRPFRSTRIAVAGWLRAIGLAGLLAATIVFASFLPLTIVQSSFGRDECAPDGLFVLLLIIMVVGILVGAVASVAAIVVDRWAPIPRS